MRSVACLLDARDPERLAQFWAPLLGRDAVTQTSGALLLPGPDAELDLVLAPTGPRPPRPAHAHLHLTCGTAEEQDALVGAALALGATRLDLGQRPEEGHVVLADPDGNLLCVLEPDNAYTRGCGRLGELTCNGSREAGFFWSAALGWPLVWDQGPQTAVQSPSGGTKVSWDEPPPAPGAGLGRHRLRVPPDPAGTDATLERLLGLGAVRLGTADDGTHELADPDGTVFCLAAD